MDNIVEPNETFDFSKLSLAHPVGVQGGAYFTKIEYNKKPLYIQTNKSQSRQGFVKTGKKYYIDLMFDKNAEVLIQWFENLEVSCQKLIFEKRDTWFQNSLEESDIESAFNSSIRVYKSGKYYLLRTNVKNNHNNIPVIKIYNEKEMLLNLEDVTSETNIISILEIQGIKFTTRNFQIEIELKQIMVLDNEPIFDNCLIKTDKPNNKILQPIKTIDNIINNIEEKDVVLEKSHIIEENIQNDTINQNIYSEENSDLVAFDIPIPDEEIQEKEISIEFDNLEDNIEEENDDLKEVNNFDLSLDNNLEKTLVEDEPIQLKKPNQVYFELYKEARNKAKIAKKNAIIAYLEAKNIKKIYMLENLIDSDSDFDAEIDEVSESELENL